MCDDLIHQGLIHEPTVSRRAFGLGAAATIMLSSSMAAAEVKVGQKDVDVPMASGVADSALFYPEGKGRRPAVPVWTDILGLRPVFREMGQRLAAQGYVVLVPNPFYRNAKAPVVDGSFDFSKPEDRAKVMPMAAALTADANISDAKSYVTFLDAQPQTDRKKKMGVQGYCMGGPLVVRTCATVPDRVGAGASFHGGGLVTKNPDSPHLLASKIKGRMYFGIGSNDDKSQPDAKDKLTESFEAANVPAEIKVYASLHGWCVPDMPPGPTGPIYNQAEADIAFGKLVELYKAALA